MAVEGMGVFLRSMFAAAFATAFVTVPASAPYGVEKNMASLEALLKYNYKQGLTPRRIQVDELFAPSTMREIPLGEGQFT
jgi:hypothetical protein